MALKIEKIGETQLQITDGETKYIVTSDEGEFHVEKIAPDPALLKKKKEDSFWTGKKGNDE
jgi:hypothetical protein